MNSRGIQLSGGVGKEMANLIVDGVTSVDMSGYNITRFQDSYVRNKKWLDERTHEAIVSIRLNCTFLRTTFLLEILQKIR